MSLEIALERSNRLFQDNIFVELKTVMLFHSIQGVNYYK